MATATGSGSGGGGSEPAPTTAAVRVDEALGMQAWIDANRHCFKPPVCNKMMSVGLHWPTARSAPHTATTRWVCTGAATGSSRSCLWVGQTSAETTTLKKAKRYSPEASNGRPTPFAPVALSAPRMP